MRTVTGGATLTTVVLLTVGVFGVSLSGVLMAAATAVPALAMSLWRTGLAAAATGTYAVAAQRAGLRAVTGRERALCLVAGFFLALHFALWTTSLRMTSVASATALVCLQAGFVVILLRVTGVREPPRVWAGVAVAFAGVLAVSGIDLSLSREAALGDLLALLGGACSAVYAIIGGRVRVTVSTTVYTTLCYAASAVMLLAASLAAGVRVWGFDARSWLLILGVTVVAQLGGHTIFNHLLATIGPTVVSMVLLLEVPGAALLAAVFLGQVPPVGVYAGLALVVAGLALVVSSRPPDTSGPEPPLPG